MTGIMIATWTRRLARKLAASALALGVVSGAAFTVFDSASAGASTGYGPYRVIGTGSDGLNERSAPSASAPRVGNLANGSTVYISCQAGGVGYSTGGTPATDGIWDQLTNGAFVADYWINTQVAGNFSRGLPRCGIAQVAIWNQNETYDVARVCGTNQSNAQECTPLFTDPLGSNIYYPDYWFKGELTVWFGNGSVEVGQSGCDVPAGYSSSIDQCNTDSLHGM
jgi:hypothetical protein